MLLKRVSRSIICKKFQEDVLNFCIFNPFRLSKALLNLYFKFYSFNSINFQFHQKFKIFYKKTITLFGRNRVLNAFSKLKILKKKLIFFFGFTTFKQVAFLFNHLYLRDTKFLFKQLLLFLEFRLDFFLFRLRYVFHVFFARTFLTTHGVWVNKKLIKIPLFHLKLGDLIEPVFSQRRALFLKFYRFWYNEFMYANKNKKINFLYKICFFRYYRRKFKVRDKSKSNFLPNIFHFPRKYLGNHIDFNIKHLSNHILLKYKQLSWILNLKLLMHTFLWFINISYLIRFYSNKLDFLSYYFFHSLPGKIFFSNSTSRPWQLMANNWFYRRIICSVSYSLLDSIPIFYFFYSLGKSLHLVHSRTFLYIQSQLKSSLRFKNFFYSSKTITVLNIKILARHVIFYDFLIRFFKQPGNWIHLHKFAKVFFIRRYLLKAFKYYRFMNYLKLKKLVYVGYRKKYFLKRLLLKLQYKRKRSFLPRFRIYRLPYFRWIKFFYSSVLNRNSFINIKMNRLNFFSTRLFRKVKYRFKKTQFFKTKVDYRAFPYLKLFAYLKLKNAQETLIVNDFIASFLFSSRFNLVNRSRYIKPVLSYYRKIFDFSLYGKIRVVDKLQYLFKNSFFGHSKHYLIFKRLDFNGYVFRRYLFKNSSLNPVFTDSLRLKFLKQFNLMKTNNVSLDIPTFRRIPIFLFFCAIQNLNLRITRKFFAKPYAKK